VPNATTNLTVTYVEPLLGGLGGLALLGIGIVVAVAGVSMHRRQGETPPAQT